MKFSGFDCMIEFSASVKKHLFMADVEMEDLRLNLSREEQYLPAILIKK